MRVAKDSSFRRALDSARPAYEIPHDDLVGEILIPAMQHADEVCIGAGFFSSRCLAQIAPGLAALLERTTDRLRLLASPEISIEDRQAIERGLHDPEAALNAAVLQILADAHDSSSATDAHCLDCLSYLVAAGRLEIRFVLMEAGMYHKKKWLIRQGPDWLAVHGSGNATFRGLLVNGEQMTIDRSWTDGPASAERVRLFVEQFDRQWENRSKHSLTVDAEQGMDFLRAHASQNNDVPTVSDFWAAWRADYEAGIEVPLPPNVHVPGGVRRLGVPSGLIWRSGRFRHQGEAVDRFSTEGCGIFSIATGGGKTKAALISATVLQDRSEGPMLLVILTPSRPLIRQWAREVDTFGVRASVLSGATPKARRLELAAVEASLRSGQSNTEVIIGTSNLYGGDEVLRGWLERVAPDFTAMLIADEVHNFGTASFLSNKPDFIAYRLGLSATPIRQYDSAGTQELLDYFGEVLVEFAIGDAIEAGCLVPYDYFVHLVELTDEEADHYSELTSQLRKTGFRVPDDGQAVILTPKMERLLRERRAVVEQADGKLSLLRDLLGSGDTTAIRRTLLYVSAKATLFGRPRQIERVNAVLADLGIVSHQFTNVETAGRDSSTLLDAFGRGDYQTLTAMKVLDEGVDIPQTETAYLMASSSVEREWVQRRGRILRTWREKDYATLHDFVVVPPEPADDACRSLIRAELRRVTEFAIYSRNEFDAGGGDEVVRELEERLKGGQGL